MIQFGIVSRDQIASKLRRDKPLPPIACTVLEELEESISDTEEIAIDVIYQGLSGGPTNSKFTHRRRYEQFDSVVIEEMERLWFELQREMTESGRISRFNSTINRLNGEQVEAEIIRVGAFDVVADGEVLQLDCRDPLAAGLDHVLGTIGDFHVTERVHVGDIAGVEPVLVIELLGAAPLEIGR